MFTSLDGKQRKEFRITVKVKIDLTVDWKNIPAEYNFITIAKKNCGLAFLWTHAPEFVDMEYKSKKGECCLNDDNVYKIIQFDSGFDHVFLNAVGNFCIERSKCDPNEKVTYNLI